MIAGRKDLPLLVNNYFDAIVFCILYLVLMFQLLHEMILLKVL